MFGRDHCTTSVSSLTRKRTRPNGYSGTAVHERLLLRPPPPVVSYATRCVARVRIQPGEESYENQFESPERCSAGDRAPRPAVCMYSTYLKPSAAACATAKATAHVDTLRRRPEALSQDAVSVVSLVSYFYIPRASHFGRLGWQGTFPLATQASAPAGHHVSWHTLLGWNNARWSRRTT